MSGPVLILPGLYDSGPEHWQSCWERAHPEFRRVEQDDWETPRCADWIARLEAAVREAGPDAVLATLPRQGLKSLSTDCDPLRGRKCGPARDHRW